MSIGSTGKDFENSLFGGGASVDGNVVYATSGVGDVAALNAEDGKLLWKVKPAGPLRGAPTVAFGGVYVITQDNQIFALNAGDGAVQWQATASIEPGSVFGCLLYTSIREAVPGYGGCDRRRSEGICPAGQVPFIPDRRSNLQGLTASRTGACRGQVNRLAFFGMTAKAVSYTHLDVYKRQHLASPCS